MASISAKAPLRVPAFRWYFASRSINLVGNTMAPVALAFAVLGISDSPGALGLVLAARTIPLLVFLLVGGVVADRLDRGLVIGASNLLSGVSQALLAALLLTGDARIWELVALSAVNGLAAAAAMPAMNGLMPQLVPRADLQAANALTSLTRAVLAVLGPGLAAVLVAGAGPGWALLIDAGTWFAAALLLLPVRVPPAAGARQPVLGELRAGWELFRRTTWLWAGVGACTVLNALQEGGFITLGPVLSDDSALGARGWGLMLSAQGVGVLVATLGLMRWRLERPLLMGLVGLALYGLPMVALGLTTTLAPLLSVCFVSGLGVQTFSLGWQLALQENVPGPMLSRAASYDLLGSYAAIPVGQLLLGRLGGVYGAGPVMLAAGIGYVAVALLPLAVAQVRHLPRVTAPASPTSAPAS